MILSLINPAPDYNTQTDSGPVSYLPSINFRLLSITRYNETRDFITSHRPISATNCFSFHFQHLSISQRASVRISHIQKKDVRIQEVRKERGVGFSCPLSLLFISGGVNRAQEFVCITFKDWDPKA